MTRRTVRDGIWETCIELATNGVNEYPQLEESDIEKGAEAHDHYEEFMSVHEGPGFVKKDVIMRVDAGDRTVHDLLRTMTDMGLLGKTMRFVQRVKHVSGTHSYDVTTDCWRRVYYPTGALAGEEDIDESDLIGRGVAVRR